ncbi:MAG: phosphoserine phosphatase SerB [Methanosarcinales archaeon]|nr:phosphoserine phosphatase SerB [Methanosarcinales archaeon]MCK4651725.1 phosphoserine phosphatase SerB [Methanosarcinales archaeon]
MKMVVFDMDSTLIDAETIDELAAIAGVGDQVAKITRQAMNGELDYGEALCRRVGLLKGLSIERANAVIDRLPLMPGAKELVESVKGMGLATAMITCGFMISARNIGDLLGIDHVIANDLATNDGVFTGEVIGDLTEADSKAHALEQLSRKCGIKPCECITIGDGANDIHLFRESGYSIAFRAKPILKQYADVAVDTKDLRAIIPIIRDVLQIDTGRTSRQNRRIPSKC